MKETMKNYVTFYLISDKPGVKETYCV